jgi:hypothetical protein
MMKGETYQSGAFDIGPEFPLTLAETYSDADLKNQLVGTVNGLQMGMEKFVNASLALYTGKLAKKPNQSSVNPVLLYGPAVVSLVCNRSGGTLAQGALTKWYTLGSITVDAAPVPATNKATLTDVGKFVANEEVGNFVYILDAVATGGVAPETETRLIIKNTANILTVQPPFSAVTAIGDTALIFSNSQVIASASGDSRLETAGIVLAPDGIPDNSFGWVCRRGRVGALIQASTAVVALKALIAHTGRLTPSSSSLFGLTVAHALVGASNDMVSDLIPVFFDTLSPQAVTA